MTNDRFGRLLRDLCASTGITDVDTVLDTGCLTVGGIDFSVYADVDAERTTDALMVYCDFGLPPEKDQLAVLRRLLELNIYLADGPSTAAYSINPDTGHVVLACQLKLSEVTSGDLAEIIASCSHEAKQWQTSYYLDAAPARTMGAAYNALVRKSRNV